MITDRMQTLPYSYGRMELYMTSWTGSYMLMPPGNSTIGIPQDVWENRVREIRRVLERALREDTTAA